MQHDTQPFDRIVNNTIHGNDGRESFFPEDPFEPNDTIHNAIDTRQGRSQSPEVYTETSYSTIGDTTSFPMMPEADVDVYQYHMDIGDHVRINVDGTGFTPVVRIFNSRGEEFVPDGWGNRYGVPTFVTSGNSVTVEMYVGEPSIAKAGHNYATERDTYYVAVSGEGNDAYSPLSLGSRTAAINYGDYSITVNVMAPRRWVIDTRALVPNIGAFQVFDVDDRSVTIVGGGVPVTVNTPFVANDLANQINGSSLQGVQATTLGTGLGVRYVVIDGASKVLQFAGPPETLTPIPGQNNDDGVLHEIGILVTEESTPALLNNILSNNRNAIIETLNQPDMHLIAEVNYAHNQGRGGDSHDEFQYSDDPVQNDYNRSPVSAVVGAQIFQHNYSRNLETGVMEVDNWGFADIVVERPIPGVASQLTMGVIVQPDDEDFNIPLPGENPLFVNAAIGDFFPADTARSIDSAVDSLEDRPQFIQVKSPMGISNSPILAPERDATGQLRVDDPDVATPQGQGANVFKDRGSLDRSDFIGPAAVLLNPRDNDALGDDIDPTQTVVRLVSGTLDDSFLIQIVDGFESADPFPGVGVNDDTVLGPAGPEGRMPGSVVTVFEDGVFLQEGIDYTYRYDTTSNTIRLTPLAGLWPDDKVYVIKLNNRDRYVLNAPSGDQATDGDMFTITNDQGAAATFEYDSGFNIQVPQSLAIQVPTSGIGDGQRFTIRDASDPLNLWFTFETDVNGYTLPGSIPVSFAATATQEEIADALVAALTSGSAQAVGLQMEAKNVGDGLVHLGAPERYMLNMGQSALTQVTTALTVAVPEDPGRPGVAFVADQQTFTIDDGSTAVTFEFDFDGAFNPANTQVDLTIFINPTLDEVGAQIETAIGTTALNLKDMAHLGNGLVRITTNPGATVDVTNSLLYEGNISRPVGDGEIVVVGYDDDGNSSTPDIVRRFEFDRDGTPLGGNDVVIPFALSETHIEVGQKLGAAVRAAAVLNLTDAKHLEDGLVYLDGTTSHDVDLTLSPTLELVGQPDPQTSTTLQLPGLLTILVPPNGGADILDGETFTITDLTMSPAEQIQTFEFFDGNGAPFPGNWPVDFVGVDANQLAQNIIDAINGVVITGETFLSGVTPTLVPGGVELDGANSNHALDTTGSVNLLQSGGRIADSETFTITYQGNTTTFEYDGDGLLNAPSATPILFTATNTLDEITNATVAAIATTPSLGLPNVQNAGDGAVVLNDTSQHITILPPDTLPPENSLSLTGIPGGAVRLPYEPWSGFTGEVFAELIIEAINGAGLEGVTASHRGGNTVFVDFLDPQNEPADFISGLANVMGISNYFLQSIQDQPGNWLKANQFTDETQFTIIMAGAALDFGDARVETKPSQYPTLFEEDGARHVITADGLFLGDRVDGDPDGQPVPAAFGDDLDHVFDVRDSALTIAGHAPFTVQLADSDGSTDGTMFTITDETASPPDVITFEFDDDGSVTETPTHRAVPFSVGDTKVQLATATVAAIVASRLQLDPVHLGAGAVHVGGEQLHSIDTSASSISTEGLPIYLIRAVDGIEISDGQMFIVSDGVEVIPTIFEFDSDGSVQVGNVPVPFSTSDDVTVVAASIKTAADAQGLALTLTDLGDGTLDVRGASSHTIDFQTSSLSYAGQTPLTVSVPAAGLGFELTPSLVVKVPKAAGGGVADAQTFTVGDGTNTVMFEFDSSGVPDNPGARIISFNPFDAPIDVATAIKDAIDQAVADDSLTDLAPTIDDVSDVDFILMDLGAGVLHSVDTSASGLDQVGAVADGETFDVNDGTNPTVTFEFDSDSSWSDVRVPFSPADSANDIANAIVTAIEGTALVDLAPKNLTRGNIQVGGDGSVDAAGTANMSEAGSADGVLDGQTFHLLDGLSTRRFEYDADGKATPGNITIGYNVTSTSDDIANATVAAIRDSGFAVNVVHLGAGQILVGDDEDGVRFDRVFTAGSAVPITVTASAEGYLDLWIDFNSDGDWLDQFEQVFPTSVHLNAGPNQLQVPVPSAAGAGETYARFRFSSQGGLSPTGLATDGEVEDYRIVIISNDPPEITVPDTQVVNEDVPLVIAGIGVADPDAITATVEVAMAVLHGTLTVSEIVPGGLIAASITDNGTNQVVLNGTLSQINTTLAAANGLVYLNDPEHYAGDDRLTIVADDLGNSGSGGPQQDVATVSITINALNDAPIVVGDLTVLFEGTLADTNVAELTIDDTNLTLDASSATVSLGQDGFARQNERQDVALPAGVTGGTFTLTYGGDTTAPILFNAPSADVQSALEVLSSVQPGNVSVTGSAGGPWAIEFQGSLGSQDLAAATINDGNLTFGASVTTTLDGDPGPPAQNEQQIVMLPGGVTGGTFTLAHGGPVSAPILFNASAADIEAALEDAGTVALNDVVVTGPDGGPWTIEFQGTDAGTNVATLTIDGSALTINTAAVTTTQDGDPGPPAQNEQQIVALPGGVTGGTFTLTHGGPASAPILFNASAADVEAALEDAGTVNLDDVVVTGPDGGPWTVEFQGTDAGTDVAQLTIDTAALNVNAAAVTTTQDGDPGPPAQNEQQIVALPEGVTGGTFTLAHGGPVSAPILFNASNADIEAALEDSATVGLDDVVVAGPIGGRWSIEFQGTDAGTDVAPLTIDGSGLTVNASAVTTAQAGDPGPPAQNEQQIVVLQQGVIGGTFTLAHGGPASVPILFNASSADVEAALEDPATVGLDDVVVTGPDGGPWTIEFQGADAGTDVASITIDGSGLAANASVTTMDDGHGGQNEQQTVSLPMGVAGGTFTLSVDGQTTTDIAFNASRADVEAALEALSNVDDVNVFGDGSSTWQVEFVGTLSEAEVALMTIDAANLIPASTPAVNTTLEGSGGQNEQQTVSLHAGVIGGTFTLTFDGETTAPIQFDASGLAVETALEALSTIDDVAVTGNIGGPWSVEFVADALRDKDVDEMTIDGTNLTPAGTPTVITTVAGSSGQNEQQSVDLPRGAIGGTFTLDFEGQTTAPIAFDAMAVDVEAALEALANVDDVDVTGNAGGPWVIDFVGDLVRDKSISQMTADGANLQLGAWIDTLEHGDAAAPQSERQVVTLPAAMNGGTFTLTFDDGTTAATTANIDFDATAAEVEAALELLPNIDNVTVVRHRWIDAIEETPLPITFLEIADADVHETPGGELVVGLAVNSGTLTVGTAAVTTVQGGAVGQNEQQTIELPIGIAGGTFTLEFNGPVTTDIPYDATAVDVRTALQVLPNIGAGNISVTGNAGGPWTVEFVASLAETDVAQLAIDPTNLVLPRTVTLTGGLAEINGLLAASVTYQADDDFDGIDRLAITAKDQGNTGAGGPRMDSQTITINVDGNNDDPLVTVPTNLTTTEDTTLTLTGFNVWDVDSGPEDITVTVMVEDGAASRGTLTINSVTGGVDPALQVAGNGTASITITAPVYAISTTLSDPNGWTYTPPDNFVGNEVLTTVANDGGFSGNGGGANTPDALTTITVTEFNDPPTVDVSFVTNTTVDEEAALPIGRIVIDDVEANPTSDVILVTLSARFGTITVGDLSGTGGVPLGNISANGTSTVAMTGTINQINVTLDGGVTYVGNLDFSDNRGSEALVVTASDQGIWPPPPAIGTETIPLTVNAVNDPPTVSVPGPLSVPEDTDLSVPLVSVADPDAEEAGQDGVITVTLNVTAGTLTVLENYPGGLPSSAITNNGSSTVVLAGKTAEINTTLAQANSLIYRGDPNASGAVTLTVTADDLGKTGTVTPPGNTIDSETVAITVVADNDAPTITVPDTTPPNELPVNEDTTLLISGIVVDDVDAGGADIQVTLAVGSGTILVDDSVPSGLAPGDISGNGSNSVVLTGTLTEINNTLGADVRYTGDLNFNGADILTVTADDLGNAPAPAESSQAAVNIEVLAVNDPPVLAGLGAMTVNEDTALALPPVTVTDVDVAETFGGTLTVTLSVGNGVLDIDLSVPNGLEAQHVLNNGASAVTVTATPDLINTTFAAPTGLTYVPDLHFNSGAGNANPDSLSVTVDDGGRTGVVIPAGNTSDNQTVPITVVAVNDAPVLNLPDDPQNPNDDLAVLEDNLLAIPFATNAVTDVDAADAPGSGLLRMSLTAANGVLMVRSDIANGLSGNDFTIGDIEIDPVSGAEYRVGSTVEFTAFETNINNTLSYFDVLTDVGGVTYRPDEHFNGTETVDMSVNDLGNTDGTLANPLVDQGSFTISVAAVNDAPELTVPVTVPPLTLQVNEDIDLPLSGPAFQVADVDAAEGTGLVALRLLVFSSSITVDTNVPGGVGAADVQYAGQGDVTLTGTPAQINATLNADGVVFRGNPNFSGQTSLELSLTDKVSAQVPANWGFGGEGRDSATLTVNVTAVNDAPTVTVPPTAQTPLATNEDTTLTINGISFDDVDDLGAANMEVELTAGRGEITVDTLVPFGVPVGDISGNESATVTLTGTKAAINATLAAGIDYKGNEHVSGIDTITVTANDKGNSPLPIEQEGDGTITVSINPVNDAPVVNLPGLPVVDEDAMLWFTGANEISVTDPDSGAGNIIVTLDVNNGTLVVNPTVGGGLDQNGISGSGTGHVVLTGTAFQIFRTLSDSLGLGYRGHQYFNGTDVLTVTANDQGNTGAGVALSDSKSTTITVNPVNNSPVVQEPIDDLTVAEDSPNRAIELFPGVFFDPDNATLDLTVINSDPSLVTASIVGTQLNLEFQPNQSGRQAEIRVTASDGVASATDIFIVTVTPVLDPPFVANEIPDVTVLEGTLNRVLNLSNVFDDPDIPPDPALTLSYNDTVDNTNRNLVTGDLNAATLTLTFAAGQAGKAQLTVHATDSTGLAVQDTFTVTVNDAPVAEDDSVVTNEDTPVAILPLANDSDLDGNVDPSTLAIVAGAGPSHGTVTIVGGVVTYTPDFNFPDRDPNKFGDDSFMYTVRDNDGFLSNPATVNIRVNEVFDYQNPLLRTDVNRDGQTSPLDALILINRINGQGFVLPPDPDPPATPQLFYDVNGDNQVTGLDVVPIVQELNSLALGEAEATPAQAVAQVTIDAIAPAGEGEAIELLAIPDYSLIGPLADAVPSPTGNAYPARPASNSAMRGTAAEPVRSEKVDSAFEILGRDSRRLVEVAMEDVLSDIADDVVEAHEGEVAEDWVLSGLRPWS